MASHTRVGKPNAFRVLLETTCTKIINVRCFARTRISVVVNPYEFYDCIVIEISVQKKYSSELKPPARRGAHVSARFTCFGCTQFREFSRHEKKIRFSIRKQRDSSSDLTVNLTHSVQGKLPLF